MAERLPPEDRRARLPCGREEYGWNDEAGNLFCAYCAWTVQVRTVEEAEFKMNAHLAEAHRRRADIRIVDGRRVDIPK